MLSPGPVAPLIPVNSFGMRDTVPHRDKLIVCTDDGSYGTPGFVTAALKEVLERDKPDLVVAIGPLPMMRAVVGVTRPLGIPTTVSLNPVMVDGTGMCGGCRVSVGGEQKFVCVDGPEFDGHQVDFEELNARLRAYREQEAESLRLFDQRAACRSQAG